MQQKARKDLTVKVEWPHQRQLIPPHATLCFALLLSGISLYKSNRQAMIDIQKVIPPHELYPESEASSNCV